MINCNPEFDPLELKEDDNVEWHRSESHSYAPRYRRPTPYERTRAWVYSTGNRWAIENFEATH